MLSRLKHAVRTSYGCSQRISKIRGVELTEWPLCDLDGRRGLPSPLRQRRLARARIAAGACDAAGSGARRTSNTPVPSPRSGPTRSLETAGVSRPSCLPGRARRGWCRHICWELKMLENPHGGRRGVEHGYEAESPVAARPRQHFDRKHAPHQVGPAPAAAGGTTSSSLLLREKIWVR